jgi:uncharacterized protein
MILESIVTTRNQDGSTNIAPMGPHCQRDSFDQFELRPFQESTTYLNLVRTGEGVMHVTDDVLLFAQAAIHRVPKDISLQRATHVDCEFLVDSCRYYEFRVSHIDSSQPRSSIQCQTVSSSRLKDFFGFNRGMYAVVEAAILATRLDFIPVEEIMKRYAEFEQVIGKTGGEREQAAFALLSDHVRSCVHRVGSVQPARPGR